MMSRNTMEPQTASQVVTSPAPIKVSSLYILILHTLFSFHFIIEKEKEMGSLSAAPVSTSQFPASSNSLRNNVSITVSPTAVIKSSFFGSCSNLRQQHRLTRLSSSYLTLSSTRSKFMRHVCKSQLVVQDFAPVASSGYAVLLLGGGLFAYNKSGSKGSLFGGLTGAVLMSAAYYLMQSHETKELGDALAFGASLLFALVFGIRFAATGKVMPAGFLLAVSMSLTTQTFSAYLQDKSMM